MKVEVLYAPGCSKCLRELPMLRAAAASVVAELEWQEIDIAQAIDYAVELGVMKPPAVAINGKLAFIALPSADALANAMRQHLGAFDGH